MIKEKITLRLKKEEEKLLNMRAALDSMPKGKLYIRHRNEKCYFTLYFDARETSITKDKVLIEELLAKETLEKRIKISTIVCEQLSSMSKKMPDDLSHNKELLLWQNSDYEKLEYKSEQLKYVTLRGDKVRSKSERVIANMLFKNKIAYRYEPAFYIEEKTFYPDFLIKTLDGEYIVWEHFGLMDNEEYYLHAINKIRKYRQAGFVQHKNLICTWEDDLLDPSNLEDILLKFLF